MTGTIVRKRKGTGERITLPVSVETKKKWEEVGVPSQNEDTRSTPTRP